MMVMCNIFGDFCHDIVFVKLDLHVLKGIFYLCVI